MDWIPALLKYLAISRSVVGAAFASSLALFIGPKFGLVEPVPKEWGFAVAAVLVFSGFLLATWFLQSTSALIARRWREESKRRSSFNLNELELSFLFLMGEQPHVSLNLANINYAQATQSRLEILQAAYQLEKKGLVRFVQAGSDLVYLTDLGRERALAVQKGIRNRAGENAT